VARSSRGKIDIASRVPKTLLSAKREPVNFFRRVFGPPLSIDSVDDVKYVAEREFPGAYEVLVLGRTCIKVTRYNDGLLGGLETPTYEAYADDGGKIQFRHVWP
jgi:hypothetical protein